MTQARRNGYARHEIPPRAGIRAPRASPRASRKGLTDAISQRRNGYAPFFFFPLPQQLKRLKLRRNGYAQRPMPSFPALGRLLHAVPRPHSTSPPLQKSLSKDDLAPFPQKRVRTAPFPVALWPQKRVRTTDRCLRHTTAPAPVSSGTCAETGTPAKILLLIHSF